MSTLENLCAKHLGEKWRYAGATCSMKGVISQAREVFPYEQVARLIAEIRAAWPTICDEDYQLARAWAGLSARIARPDGPDAEAIDEQRLAAFEATIRRSDFAVPCPV